MRLFRFCNARVWYAVFVIGFLMCFAHGARAVEFPSGRELDQRSTAYAFLPDLHSVRSSQILWAMGRIEQGDTITGWCGHVLDQYGVRGEFAVVTCWHAVADANDVAPRALNSIRPGQELVLPLDRPRAEAAHAFDEISDVSREASRLLADARTFLSDVEAKASAFVSRLGDERDETSRALGALKDEVSGLKDRINALATREAETPEARLTENDRSILEGLRTNIDALADRIRRIAADMEAPALPRITTAEPSDLFPESLFDDTGQWWSFVFLGLLALLVLLVIIATVMLAALLRRASGSDARVRTEAPILVREERVPVAEDGTHDSAPVETDARYAQLERELEDVKHSLWKLTKDFEQLSRTHEEWSLGYVREYSLDGEPYFFRLEEVKYDARGNPSRWYRSPLVPRGDLVKEDNLTSHISKHLEERSAAA